MHPVDRVVDQSCGITERVNDRRQAVEVIALECRDVAQGIGDSGDLIIDRRIGEIRGHDLGRAGEPGHTQDVAVRVAGQIGLPAERIGARQRKVGH